ncbi:hypothetical protein BH23GEM9_BH23GEM9_17260 [soil metagenome]
MSTTPMRTRRRAVLTSLLLVAVGACAPLDHVVGDVLHPNGRSIDGEIRSLDSRRGRLQVREDYGNRTQTIHYDNRTRILYGQRQYPASSLRRGDHVRVLVTEDRSGNRWAERIDVRSSSREPHASTRIQRLDGRVQSVDTRRGYFAIEQSRNTSVMVYVPQRINSGEARRFQRLRRGDRVRVEVRQAANNSRAVELVRFR